MASDAEGPKTGRGYTAGFDRRDRMGGRSLAMDVDSPRRFPIRVEPRYRLVLRLFGVTGSNAHVDVGDQLDARFGWFRVSTPLSNCTSWAIEGPWRAVTAIGVRSSPPFRDLTFAGTPRGGVRIDFREGVRYGPLRLEALYVTVDDLAGFGRHLEALGMPGGDRRAPPISRSSRS